MSPFDQPDCPDPDPYGDTEPPTDPDIETELDLVLERVERARAAPPTREDVRRLLGREPTDADWLDLQELLPLPVACIDCGIRLEACTPAWLRRQGWAVWLGGCRCNACVLRRMG